MIEKLPKRLRLPNELLQKNIECNLPKIKSQIIPFGSLLAKVTVIAGKGVETKIRSEQSLIQAYGGEIGDWQKKTAVVLSQHFRYELHYYSNGNSLQYLMKTKGEAVFNE